MIDALVAAALDAAESYGVWVLFLLFVFEGALVGKLLPTRAVFVAVLLAVGTGWVGVASVAAAVAGATAGQLLVFASVRHTGDGIESRLVDAGRGTRLAAVASGSGRAEQWLDRWGLPAVALSNALPLVRGSLTVPTALSEAPASGFLASSIAGTLAYVGALSGGALLVDGAIALAG